ncbi:MAG: TetR/AcrR family transcriptional regulator [Treponema sp.]|nr:TetR/AcrR family transcriptional regulator [Treponema sp.]
MPRQENTRELFLIEALALFAERGYDKVTLTDIAKKVGCTASALYKHFKSKEELYEEMLKESISGYQKSMREIHADFANHPELKEKFVNTSEEDQIKMIHNLMSVTLHTETVARFRKLMIVEQFNRRELAELYDKRYIEYPIAQHEALFKVLIEAGKVKPADPRMLAIEYVSPVIMLITVCDRNPDFEEKALEILSAHVHQFNEFHRT